MSNKSLQIVLHEKDNTIEKQPEFTKAKQRRQYSNGQEIYGKKDV